MPSDLSAVLQRPADDDAPQAPRRARWFPTTDVVNLLPAALLAVALLQTATRWHAGHRELLLAVLVVLVTQVLPGVVVWRCARPREGTLLEDVVAGLPVGAMLAIAGQVVANATAVRWAAWLLPLVVAAVLLAVPSTRERVRHARTSRLPWTWGLVVALASALPAFQALKEFREPVRWAGWAEPYVDMPYHLALAGELTHGFPPHYPQVAGDTLFYHWFTHAWVAQVAGVSGAPLDVVLTRFLPVVLAVTVPLLMAVTAMRVAGLVWAGPLAAVAGFAVVQLDVWGAHSVRTSLASFESPTAGFGTFLLLPTIALLTMRWRGQVGRWTYPLLVLLLVGAGGSKGSEVPVLVVGALLASAAAVLGRHPQWRRVLLDTGTALVVLVLLIKLVFGGGTGGTTVAPMRQLLELQGDLLVGRSSDVTGPALLSFLLLAMVPIFGGAVAGLRVVLGRDTRSDPMGWALLGCALAGAGAIVALAHPSLSTYYFLFAADAPLSVLIGWGLALMLRHVGRPVALAVTGAVAGVGGVLVTGAVLGDLEGSTSRQQHAYAALLLFLAVVGVVALVAGVVLAGPEGRRRATIAVAVAALSFAGVTDVVRELRSPLPPARFGPVKQAGAISAVEVRAARWLRDHSQRDDLVMTNRHCRAGTGPHCDHRRFVVAAYAERGLLLEGWAYTRTSNRLGTDEVSGNRVGFWNQDLLRLNDGFLTDPNAADARRLWDLGVRWAFVQRSAPHADTLAPYATEKAHFGPVRIYRLREPGAAR